MNTLVCGMPGSGKSTLLVTMAEQILRSIKAGRKVKLLVTDEHGPFAREAGKWAVRLGLQRKTAYDELSCLDRGIGYRMRSSDCDALQRKREREGFMEFVGYKRGFEWSYQHPFYREGGRIGWNLVTERKVQLPLEKIRWVLRPGKMREDAILACNNQEAWREAVSLAAMSRGEQDKVIRPALRALDDLFDGVVFRSRCDGTYEFGDITIVEGSPLVSPEELRVTIGMIVMQAIERGMVDDYEWFIICDEAINLGTTWMARRLEEIRKFGVHVTLAVQSPEWPDDVRRRIAQACGEHWYGLTSDYEVAQWQARNLLTKADPGRVEKQSRVQQFHAGHETRKVGGREVLVALYEEREVEFDRHVSLKEQIDELQWQMMGLDVGQFFVRRKGVRFVQVPERPAYPLYAQEGEKRLKKAIERMKRREYYVDIRQEEAPVGGQGVMRKVERWKNAKN